MLLCMKLTHLCEWMQRGAQSGKSEAVSDISEQACEEANECKSERVNERADGGKVESTCVYLECGGGTGTAVSSTTSSSRESTAYVLDIKASKSTSIGNI